jgi:hypothetical protein
MKYLVLTLFILFTHTIQSQTVAINTKNNKLNISQLNYDKSTYVVYFQDKPNTPKYNIEIWDREVNQNSDNTFNIKWLRQAPKSITEYDIKVDDNFKPISEATVSNSTGKQQRKEVRKYFVFDKNSMYTHQDTIKHNQSPYSIQNTALAFNWELDLETLSMLPLEDYTQFDINFYHPGSETEPKYYTYKKVGEEKVSINNQSFNCWILKIDHNEKQWSEFWIDQKNHKVLQMRDYFYGKYRYKKLMI